jgi:uncharacterized protein
MNAPLQPAKAARSSDVVDEVTARMVAAFNPSAIYLFGSRAWGEPRQDSDVDLLVVVASSDDPPWTRASKGFARLRGVGVGCDLLVRTQAEVQAEGRFASSLISKILRDGKRVYTLSPLNALAAQAQELRMGY